VLAIGAPGENSYQDTNEEPALGAGAVYIFRLEDTTWSQETMLKPSNKEGGQGFGRSVTLRLDGKRVATGAPKDNTSPDDGKCWAWESWLPLGETCEYSGAAYVFAFDGSGWYLEAYIKDQANVMWGEFGDTVIFSDSGDVLAIGSTGQVTVNPANIGIVSIYRHDAAGWAHSAYFDAARPNQYDAVFIGLLALSGDGKTLATVVGIDVGPYDDIEFDFAVRVYRFDGMVWAEQDTVWSDTTPHNCRIWGADISADGNVIAGGGYDDPSNVICVLEFDRQEWITTYVKASNTGAYDSFGRSVALSADGTTLVIGAGREDSGATGINGDQSDNSTEDSGAVYVY